MKHLVGDRVLFKEDGETHRGRVTRVLRGQRRVVTDTGHRMVLPARRLRPAPDRVLVLEGRLDRSLRSTRSYARMLKQWLHAYGVEVLHEKVHTVEALHQFLKREGKNARTRFIHLICHASEASPGAAPQLYLTFEALDLLEDLHVFHGLAGKILIFSCCDVGAHTAAMNAVKEASGVAAVA